MSTAHFVASEEAIRPRRPCCTNERGQPGECPTDVFDDAHAKQGGPGAFTANSGDKTLIKNRLLIREAKCFYLI